MKLNELKFSINPICRQHWQKSADNNVCNESHFYCECGQAAQAQLSSPSVSKSIVKVSSGIENSNRNSTDRTKTLNSTKRKTYKNHKKTHLKRYITHHWFFEMNSQLLLLRFTAIEPDDSGDSKKRCSWLLRSAVQEGTLLIPDLEKHRERLFEDPLSQCHLLHWSS